MCTYIINIYVYVYDIYGILFYLFILKYTNIYIWKMLGVLLIGSSGVLVVLRKT
jgi:hypothetical protein